MDWIHWVLFVSFCVVYFVAAYFYDKTKDQKKKIEHYKKAYHEAKEAWAAQSNAVREKGIECGIVEKVCMDWKEKHEKAEKDLKELKKRLMIKIG